MGRAIDHDAARGALSAAAPGVSGQVRPAVFVYGRPWEQSSLEQQLHKRIDVKEVDVTVARDVGQQL